MVRIFGLCATMAVAFLLSAGMSVDKPARRAAGNTARSSRTLDSTQHCGVLGPIAVTLTEQTGSAGEVMIDWTRRENGHTFLLITGDSPPRFVVNPSSFVCRVFSRLVQIVNAPDKKPLDPLAPEIPQLLRNFLRHGLLRLWSYLRSSAEILFRA